MKNELRYKLLWSTIESFVGLWELRWEANSIVGEDASKNEDLIKKLFLYFLETGLVELYFDKWGSEELQAIDQKEAMEIIKGDDFWHPPKMNDICVKIGSTKKGEKYYNEKLLGDINPA